MNNTTLITGGTGYIGSWIVKYLLEKGQTVRVTVRDKNRKDKIQHLVDMEDKLPGKLEFWEADLLKKGSFDEAVKGCEIIYHIASPFKLKIKDPYRDLIDPAVKGTRNVLNAANNSGTVKKVVLTSSVAAIHGDNKDMKEQNLQEFTEEQWNTSSSPKHQPYSYSKVAAEKEAWKIYDAQNNWKLVVINPSFVMGPSLTKATESESLTFMKDMLNGKFAMGAPDLCFGFVDVRDVANAHVLAGEKTDAEGRHLLAERTANILELANVIKQEFGDEFKVPTKKSPKFLMFLMGWMFGVSIKFVKRNIGYPIKLNNSKSKEKLGLSYTPFNKTVRSMVEQMKEQGLV